MTDLTPEREQDFRTWANGQDEDEFARRIALELLAALDAERARADKAEQELAKYEEPGWINAVQKVVQLQARNRSLEAVVEAARDLLSTPLDSTDEQVKEARYRLLDAFARLDANEDTE